MYIVKVIIIKNPKDKKKHGSAIEVRIVFRVWGVCIDIKINYFE